MVDRQARSASAWLDESSDTPIISEKAQQMDAFLEAMADGRVDAAEVHAQEARLVALMKEVEPLLDDQLHEKVTRLLCELTVYDLMRVLHTVHQTRPRSTFQG